MILHFDCTFIICRDVETRDSLTDDEGRADDDDNDGDVETDEGQSSDEEEDTDAGGDIDELLDEALDNDNIEANNVYERQDTAPTAAAAQPVSYCYRYVFLAFCQLTCSLQYLTLFSV